MSVQFTNSGGRSFLCSRGSDLEATKWCSAARWKIERYIPRYMERRKAKEGRIMTENQVPREVLSPEFRSWPMYCPPTRLTI
jgi:hypothetical protein